MRATLWWPDPAVHDRLEAARRTHAAFTTIGAVDWTGSRNIDRRDDQPGSRHSRLVPRQCLDGRQTFHRRLRCVSLRLVNSWFGRLIAAKSFDSRRLSTAVAAPL